jgi:hypothetical protein
MKNYAQKVNDFFKKTSSHFISLRERLNECLTGTFPAEMDAAIAEFKRRNKQWKKFADLHLCQSLSTTMDKILIDTTMQRQVNFEHVLSILDHFKETMVMAIQVYEDPEKPGYYVAWDGQHTAIVLYILATKIFGERAGDITVPIVVYPVKMKAEIRRNFILLNGEAKKPLDFYDKYRQMVCGVLIDGSSDPVWEAAAKKQEYLQNAGLFVTHEKMGDEDQDGAFTLLAGTIMSDSEKSLKDIDVTRMFAEYWSLLRQERPVEPKEARQLYEYFNICHEQGIEVDRAYLIKFTQFTKDYFDADFSPNGPFWSKVKDAYTSWYESITPPDQKEYNAKGELIVRGFTTEMRTGIPFLIAQLKASTKLAVPKYEANNGFTVKKAWLWEVIKDEQVA